MKASPVERWTIPGPGPDESLESVVERADRYYDGWLQGLGRRLDVRPAARGAGEGVGGAIVSTSDMRTLASRLDVPASALVKHRLLGGPGQLDPPQRRAFCAACWAADDQLGRPRAFRRAWASIWGVSCAIHGMPLTWCSAAPAAAQPQRILARWSIDRNDLPLAASLAAIEVLLEACATRERLRQQVQLMAAVLCENWSPTPGKALLESLQRPSAVVRWLIPVRVKSTALRSPKDALARLGHPGARRAALAAVAVSLVPATGPSLPLGLPYRPFEVWDAQWLQASPHYARRHRRFYEFLRGVASAWWGPQHVPPIHRAFDSPPERWARRRGPIVVAPVRRRET